MIEDVELHLAKVAVPDWSENKSCRLISNSPDIRAEPLDRPPGRNADTEQDNRYADDDRNHKPHLAWRSLGPVEPKLPDPVQNPETSRDDP